MAIAAKALTLAFLLSATDKMSKVISDATKKSSESLSSFERTSTKVGASIMKRGAAMTAMGVAVGAAVVGAAKSTAAYGDAAWKTSQQVGVNVEEWQKLAYAAKYSGLEQEEFASGMNKFNKVMVAASSGSKEAAQIFSNLGVNLKDAQGKLRNPDEVFKEFADIFSSMENGAEKSDLAMKLWGKSGAKMIPLLNTGKKGIAEMGEEAERTGNVLKKEATIACEAFNDNLERLTTNANGLKNQFSAALMPLLNDLAVKFQGVISKVTAWLGRNPELASTIGKVALVASGLLITLGVLATIIGAVIFTAGKFVAVWNGAMSAVKAGKLLFTAISKSMLVFRIQYATLVVWQKLAAAAQWLFNTSLYGCPVVWIIAAIMAVIAAVILLVKNWDKVSAFFVRLWDGIKKVFLSVWNWIKNMFLNYTPYGLIIKHWDVISAWFVRLWDSVKFIFVNAWDGIKNFFVSLNPIEWLVSVFSTIGEFFAELKTRFFNWGGEIIQGLIDGIVEFAVKIWETISNIGKKIGDTFCSILGINSPSRVFAEYGVNITQGLTGGLTQGEAAVSNATGGLAMQATKGIGQSIFNNSIGASGNSIGGFSLSYAPSITITGGASPETEQNFLVMLRSHRDEIVSIIQRYIANKTRLSFSN